VFNSKSRSWGFFPDRIPNYVTAVFTHTVIDLSIPAKHQFNQEDAEDA